MSGICEIDIENLRDIITTLSESKEAIVRAYTTDDGEDYEKAYEGLDKVINQQSNEIRRILMKRGET